MRHRITVQDGSALVTALLLTMIMLTVGLASLAQVDVQQEQSGVERIRETTFNLGEGVLNAQIFALSQRWPGPGAGAGTPAVAPFVFGPCTQASDPVLQPNCPNPATIRSLFTSPDTAAATTWRTEVRDNATTLPVTCPSSGSTPSAFYSDASTAGQPPFDCNADGRVWARAEATVRGRTRRMIALVQAERETQPMPRSVLLAGRLEVGTNGNKLHIDAQADTALTTNIAVRCTPDLLALIPCIKVGQETGLLDTLWSATKLPIQLNGTKPQTGYPSDRVLSLDALERLKRTAITNGTYFETCPTDASKLQGAVVYVETCNQTYNSTTVINTPENPGALIIADGTITLKGNITYHGMLYHANLSNATGVLVELSGNSGRGVEGGVHVEGAGGFKIDGSGVLRVNGKAFDALRSYGSAGIIQNTWREIPTGT